jgi:arabinan endo-1,5-alpha-L-arabinosidase
MHSTAREDHIDAEICRARSNDGRAPRGRDGRSTAMTAGGGTQVLAGHGSIHGPGHQAVIADADAEVLFYHDYADNGAARLGINLVGYDAAGWPFVH